jgi:hypothetical protein
MTISLFVLVDKEGRVLYTGNQSAVEDKKEYFQEAFNEKTQIVELKGEY